MNGTPLRTNNRYSSFLLISGIRWSYLYNQAWWDFHSQHRTCKYSLVRDLGMYHQHMGQDWGNRQCLRKKEIKRGFNMGGSRIDFLAILVQNIWKKHASIQCWAIIGPPAKRHLNGVSHASQWLPTISASYLSHYLPNIRCASKTFWIRACLILVFFIID